MLYDDELKWLRRYQDYLKRDIERLEWMLERDGYRASRSAGFPFNLLQRSVEWLLRRFERGIRRAVDLVLNQFTKKR